MEETTHYAEGTAEHSALVRLLSSDRAFVESTVERLLENPNYGFDAARLRAIGDKIASGEMDMEALTDDELMAYGEFSSELGAHMSAEMLGNEAFIDRIIRSDASLAEKIIGKIVDAKEALGRIGDPEAQVQHKRLAAAEKLYFKAIEAAGYQYVNGKIVVPEEEKENTAEGGVKYNLKEDKNGKGREEGREPREEVYGRVVRNEREGRQTISYTDDKGRVRLLSEIVRGRKKLQEISRFAESFYALPKNTEQSVLQKRAADEGVNLFFAQGTKVESRYWFDNDGQNLFVDEDITFDEYVEILDQIKPIERITDPKKIAQISDARWNYFLRYNPDSYKDTQNIYVARMRIQDFLDLNTEGKTDQRLIYAESKGRSKTAPVESIQETHEDHMYLRIDLDTGEVLDHEGRHRMTALLNEGYEYADVFILLDSDKTISQDYIPKLQVKGQFNGDITRTIDLLNAQSKNYANHIKTIFRHKGRNLRYSLKEDAGAVDSKQPTSYTKEEARGLVDRVMTLFSGEGYSGALPGKRAEAIRRAHAILNGAEAGKRFGAALDFADYLIRSAVLEDDVTANPDYELHVRTLEALKPYLRRLDLDSIRGDIQHRYDDRARVVFARWGKTKTAETLG